MKLCQVSDSVHVYVNVSEVMSVTVYIYVLM
jgi:hypothetical protein